MYKMVSFLFQPTKKLPIKVYDLMSHYTTKRALRLAKYDHSRNAWREGYYTSDGEVGCAPFEGMGLTPQQCTNAIKAKFPTFVRFINFCFEQIGDTYEGDLNLSDLTSLKGIKLPKTVKGYFAFGATSVKEVKLPKYLEGGLCLDKLTSAKGLKLPNPIKGFLSLNGLTSAKGLELPSLTGDLYLNGLESDKDLRLPFDFRQRMYSKRLISSRDAVPPQHGYILSCSVF